MDEYLLKNKYNSNLNRHERLWDFGEGKQEGNKPIRRIKQRPDTPWSLGNSKLENYYNKSAH